MIASLPGVVSVRILLDDSGSLGEIHVLADVSRPAKAIVRDIESSLAARWGMAVDHRRISVAQVAETLSRAQPGRLRLQQWAVTIDPVRGSVEVAVTLTPGMSGVAAGQEAATPGTTAIWQGRAAGNSQVSLRVGAEAAVEAVNQAVSPQHRFALVDVARVSLGRHAAVVCLLHLRGPRGGQTLTGSALVRDEAGEAAIRSVLNGTNRLYELVARAVPEAGGSDEARVRAGLRRTAVEADAEAAAAADPADADVETDD